MPSTRSSNRCAPAMTPSAVASAPRCGSTMPASAASPRQRSSRDARVTCSASASDRRRDVRSSASSSAECSVRRTGSRSCNRSSSAGSTPASRAMDVALARALDAAADRWRARHAHPRALTAPTNPTISAATLRWARARPAAAATATTAQAAAASPATRPPRSAASRLGSSSSITAAGRLRSPVAAISRRSAASRASSPPLWRAVPDTAISSPRRRCARSPIVAARQFRPARSPRCPPRSVAPSLDGPEPFPRRPASVLQPPRRSPSGLGQLAAKRGDLSLGVEREARIGGGRFDLCGLDLRFPHHLGETDATVRRSRRAAPASRARSAATQCSVSTAWVASSSARRSWSTLPPPTGVRASARVRSRTRRRAVATPSGLVVRRSDPTRSIASRMRTSRLCRRDAAAGVGETLDRLLELTGPLTCALRRVDAQPVVAEPRGCAEDRLVDTEMESSRGHGAPAAQLVGELRSAELEHLNRPARGCRGDGRRGYDGRRRACTSSARP